MCPEIIVVASSEPEGITPSMQLCEHLTNVTRVTLVIPNHVFPPVLDPLRQNPRALIVEIPPQDPPNDYLNQIMIELKGILFDRPVCAIIDIAMGWTAEIFHNIKVPTIAFFNANAPMAAIELAMWMTTNPWDLIPDEMPVIASEPEEIPVTNMRRPGGPPPQQHEAGDPDQGPVHGVGHQGPDPVWVELVEGSIAVMIYTNLGRQFIDNIAKQLGKPVWAVGFDGATLDTFKKAILKKVN